MLLLHEIRNRIICNVSAGSRIKIEQDAFGDLDGKLSDMQAYAVHVQTRD